VRPERVINPVLVWWGLGDPSIIVAKKARLHKRNQNSLILIWVYCIFYIGKLEYKQKPYNNF
jgi:hypothetical protein